MSRPTTDIFFLRHGILSDDRKMAYLEMRLGTILPGWVADNRSYDWKAPVLQSGILLAGDVLRKLNEVPLEDGCRLLLIGHSQGGLVARVAAATIVALNELESALVPSIAKDRPYLRKSRELLQGLRASFSEDQFSQAKASIVGVVTMATPNSGAFTLGQVSFLGRLVNAAAVKALSIKLKDLPDLQSDRLFRILQRVRVPDVRYFSISGSAANKYSLFAHSDLAELTPLKRLAPHLDLPNDTIVEDISVNLENAPLPSEMVDLSLQYQHVRTYEDCTDITHTGIHGSDKVLSELRQCFDSWGLYAR